MNRAMKTIMELLEKSSLSQVAPYIAFTMLINKITSMGLYITINRAIEIFNNNNEGNNSGFILENIIEESNLKLDRELNEHFDSLISDLNRPYIPEIVLFELLEIIFSNNDKLKSCMTPVSIAKIFSRLLNIQEDEKVIEPCFGFGTLSTISTNQQAMIIGSEIDPIIFNMHKMMQPLLKRNFYIENHDSFNSIDSSINERGILVLNYPFKPQVIRRNNSALEISEISFIKESLKYMNQRGAILVHEGLLIKSFQNEEAFRKELIENLNLVEAVISLPPCMLPYIRSATSILVLNENKKDKSIFMMRADSFINKESLDFENENRIYDFTMIYQRKYEIDNISRVVLYEEIVNNDYSLGVNRYIKSEIRKESILSSDEIKKIEELINSIRTENDELLKML